MPFSQGEKGISSLPSPLGRGAGVRESTGSQSPAPAVAFIGVALAGFLAALHSRRLGPRLPASLQAGGEGALAGGRIVFPHDALVDVIERHHGDYHDDE